MRYISRPEKKTIPCTVHPPTHPPDPCIVVFMPYRNYCDETKRETKTRILPFWPHQTQQNKTKRNHKPGGRCRFHLTTKANSIPCTAYVFQEEIKTASPHPLPPVQTFLGENRTRTTGRYHSVGLNVEVNVCALVALLSLTHYLRPIFFLSRR